MFNNKKWQHLAEQVYEAQNNKKYWADKEAQLKSSLIEYSGDCPHETKSFKLDRIERMGSVDYKIIPELKTIDLSQYRGKPVVSWKLVKKVELL